MDFPVFFPWGLVTGKKLTFGVVLRPATLDVLFFLFLKKVNLSSLPGIIYELLI